MSTVAPPPTTAPPPPAPPPPPTAVAPTPPQAYRALAVGTRLDAVIINIGSKGAVEVSTELGKITLRTSFALPKDGPLQLQVQTIGRQIQFLITSVNGQPVSTGAKVGAHSAAFLTGGLKNTGSAATHAGSASATPGAAAPVLASVQLTVGSTLTATLLHAVTAPGAAAAGQPASKFRGAAVNLSGQGIRPATTGATAPGTTARISNAPTTPTPARATRSGGGAPSAAGRQKVATRTPSPIPAGSTLTLKITGLQIPQPGAPQPPLPSLLGASLSVGQTLTGVVTGATSGGQTIVQTPAGPIVLGTQAALPTGTQVRLEVISPPAIGDTSAADAVARRLGQMILETRNWPGLEDGVQALREASPTAAQQLLNVLPRADATLTANVLFFIAALRGGDLRGWLGDAPVRALERGRPNVLQRLKEDFGNLGRLADDGGGNDWRSTPVPFVNGQQIEQIRMSVRRDHNDESDEGRPGRGAGVRFVVDLDLSRLGRLQMDGFVEEKIKRFTLIVRTDKKLPSGFENGIRTIFMEVNDATGIKGGLSFQAAPPNFVEVAPPKSTANELGLSV